MDVCQGLEVILLKKVWHGTGGRPHAKGGLAVKLYIKNVIYMFLFVVTILPLRIS